MRSACPLIVPQSHLTLFPSDHLSQHSQAGRLQRDWADFVEHQKILSCPLCLPSFSPCHPFTLTPIHSAMAVSILQAVSGSAPRLAWSLCLLQEYPPRPGCDPAS